MNAKRLFYCALAGMSIHLGASQGVLARTFLVIGSTDHLWPIAPELPVETRGWIEMGGRRPESLYPQTRGFVLLDTSETHVGPFLVTPDFNISLGWEARGGATVLKPFGYGEIDTEWLLTLDGDVSTHFYSPGGAFALQYSPRVDLGGIFPVNRVVFYTHPDRPDLYLDAFTLFVNDGDPAKIKAQGSGVLDPQDLLWEQVHQETENKEPAVEITFPIRPVRHVLLIPQRSVIDLSLLTGNEDFTNLKPWEIAEFEIHGQGYVAEATYISEIIDIPQAVPGFSGTEASWGRLYWVGNKDKNARVVIRTRTGTDNDPNIYWWNTARGNELSTLKLDGTLLTLQDYEKFPPPQRGPITYDTENWSFWSPPYDFDKGVEGVSIASPGPRSYLQFRIDFFSTITDGSRIESFGFDFSPPSAQFAIAEIFPRQVNPGADTTFTYFLRPTLRGSDLGFDSLEIETLVRPSRVRSVRIKGDKEVIVDLAAYPPEILNDRVIVHFPRFDAKDTRKLLEVDFDVRVVRYNTEFRGRIFDQASDEVRQLVDAGDATNAYSGDGISVTIPFTEQIISSVELTPNPFSPNGDGINDQLRISYTLLNLTEATETSLTIYDLSGRPVRQLPTERLLSGIYQWSWNGQADGGGLVSPGNYIYRISVKTDTEHEQRSGAIAVAY